MSTTLETIEEHIRAAAGKLADLADVHLPAIEEFISTLAQNPLVTAFSSVVPGGIGADTQAVLNGLAQILGELGTKSTAPAPSPAEPAPAVPGPAAPGEVTP